MEQWKEQQLEKWKELWKEHRMGKKMEDMKAWQMGERKELQWERRRGHMLE
jgi:hypothetical protein